VGEAKKNKKAPQDLKRGRRPISKRDHKYSRGVVAIVAGSKRFPGAALLTVGGARQGGAGYVKFLDGTSVTTQLVISHYPDVAPITSISNEKIDALVVGPGATTLRSLPEKIPVVLDSGALSLASKTTASRDPEQIIVVTPHEGELGELGFSIPAYQGSQQTIDAQRKDVAQRIADQLNVICVLKGHRTVIAAPQRRILVNSKLVDSELVESKRPNSILIDSTGGSELATAGSGDILAGLVGAFLASWKPLTYSDAQRVVWDAVHLHSAAGAHAARRKKSVVATDILESLAYC
jgi:NAD(P)H-hydrate repair Nnr-like enzyme with NAD(P)H-hydrate dehydratase domain